MRVFVALAFLYSISGAIDAQAETGATEMSGWGRLDYFSSSRTLDTDTHFLSAAAALKLEHAIADDQRLKFEAWLRSEDLTRSPTTTIRWINAYWLAETERVDVRIGQQAIRWGKADGINPTDFFTPNDYTTLLPLEDDRYLSVPAVRTDVHITDTDSMVLVAEPDFTPTRLPWPSDSPVQVIDDEPSGWRQPQLGVRWLHTAENLDWSLSGFHGFTTLPVLNSLTTVGAQYSRYYPRMLGFGADVARNFGKVGFRAELAYSEYSGMDDRQTVAANYFLVSGVDRSFGDVNVNVQALLRYVPDYRSTLAATTPQQQFAAIQNAIVYGQQNRVGYGMTTRIGSSWLNQTLSAELLVVAQFDPGNALIRPLITYALSDRYKVRLGGEYYCGPQLSFFGSLKQNRTVFAEAQVFY